ncbi:MAG: hypothetical protein DWQ07_06525 [Chloroflexi bacterium]|nr:MAG: hypothetical protein DWQ07_06525 [Chloroflexota bacterium]MBL1195915.1 hypothetical protein [Chloroflexota bacterium]NOH13208.1 hypothetical protein [Chloroflexota bacterium]
MAKTAIIVLAASDTPEGRGRMVHAIHAARELKTAGEEIKMLFEGIGVTWLDAFHKADHPFTQNYGSVFEEIKDTIEGACNFCTTGRFEVGDAVETLGIPLLGPEGGHYSLGNLVANGYQIVTF